MPPSKKWEKKEDEQLDQDKMVAEKRKKLTVSDLGLTAKLPAVLLQSRQQLKQAKKMEKKVKSQRIKETLSILATSRGAISEHKEFVEKAAEAERAKREARKRALHVEHIKAQNERKEKEVEDTQMTLARQKVVVERILADERRLRKAFVAEQAQREKEVERVRQNAPDNVHIHVARTEAQQTQRAQLPVLREEQAIMEAVLSATRGCVLVCGETGSGKTTQVPQFLWESGFGHEAGVTFGREGLIAVTEPRRVAAVSMARRVAEELNVTFGEEVCYHVRYDNNLSEHCRLKFVTEGILLKEVQSDFLLRRYSAIIIDEAHERSISGDVLIGLLSRIVPLRYDLFQEELHRSDINGDISKTTMRPLKLVIMSATMRVSDFRDNRVLFPTAPPLINVEARLFPVSNHFSKRTELRNYVREAFKKVRQIHKKLPPGGVLVFLSTQREIETLCHMLREHYSQTRIYYNENEYNKHSQLATRRGEASYASSLKQIASGGDARASSLPKDDGGASGAQRRSIIAWQEPSLDCFGLEEAEYALQGDEGAADLQHEGGGDGCLVSNFPGARDDFDYRDMAYSVAAAARQSETQVNDQATVRPAPKKSCGRRSRNHEGRDSEDKVSENVEGARDGSSAGVLQRATRGRDVTACSSSSTAVSKRREKQVKALGGPDSLSEVPDSAPPVSERYRSSNNCSDNEEDEYSTTTSDAEGDDKDAQQADRRGPAVHTDGGEDEEDGDYDTLYVLPLYALLDFHQQQLVFQPPPPGKRLCVVATNVAETSITIPNIRYVVDTGREKTKTVDSASGATRYEVGWTSQASAQQRSGRAGRTGPGHCYRLYSTAVYSNLMSPHSTPEILRTPLESVVLLMKHIGIDHVTSFPFPTNPSAEDIQTALVHLHAIGALDSDNGYRITPLGKQLVSFPIPPRFARMILEAHVIQRLHPRLCEYVLIITAVYTSASTIFTSDAALFRRRPPQQTEVNDDPGDRTRSTAAADTVNNVRDERYTNVRSLFHGGSDFLTVLRAFGVYCRRPNAYTCRRYCLVQKPLGEARQLFFQLRVLAAMLHPAEENGTATLDTASTRVDKGELPDTLDWEEGDSTLPSSATNTQSQRRRFDADECFAGDGTPLLTRDEEVKLRQVFAVGLVDQLARRATVHECRSYGVKFSDKKTSKVPYLLLRSSTIAYIHPSSACAAAHPPPEYVAFSHLQQSVRAERRADKRGEMADANRMMMMGVTSYYEMWLREANIPLDDNDGSDAA